MAAAPRKHSEVANADAAIVPRKEFELKLHFIDSPFLQIPSWQS
jgi:hypothetical protein